MESRGSRARNGEASGSAFFLSKFNLLVVFTYNLRFSNSVLLLFNHDIRFPTSTFVLFNLDSRFLSAAFVFLSTTFVIKARHSF